MKVANIRPIRRRVGLKPWIKRTKTKHVKVERQKELGNDAAATQVQICQSLEIIAAETVHHREWPWHYPGVNNADMRWQISLVLCLLCLASCQAKCREEPARDCEAICDAIGGNCSIRALVLLPNDDGYEASLQRVLPILKVAEQQIRATALIPSYIDFHWLAHDTKCDASLGVIRAMDGIIKQCAQVIFGPVCDYSLAAVSRITKYFNSQGTPLITVGGSTYDFEQKKTDCADEFYMLLRTGMLSFESISELTINVMKQHNWTHSIFYYERDGQRSVAGLHTCFLMMKSLGKQMRNENMTFAQYPLESNTTNRSEEMRREIGNKHSSSVANMKHVKRKYE
ncbi:atrial natriuretic peptide receptor 3-like isoform X2 [Drosophila innubila]|uniref:atrial natriuretic peptide receptor 3-like isoform X2 n=1 Tax=Drosophila innubila TaxID=198719 RepID=UPI00148CA02E|nr:atrial natriuretic peptide receptor 3-like isoform X2 [Drosophila innubila]